MGAIQSATYQGAVDFYGVSGLTYVADFARWWALHQEPNHPATKAFLEAQRRTELEHVSICFWMIISNDSNVDVKL